MAVQVQGRKSPARLITYIVKLATNEKGILIQCEGPDRGIRVRIKIGIDRIIAEDVNQIGPVNARNIGELSPDKPAAGPVFYNGANSRAADFREL